MNHKLLFFIALALLMPLCGTKACTNFICSRGASADGSTMITYAADSHTRYGQLRFHRGAIHADGELVKLYNYGSLKFQIEIPQAHQTYNVVGFINEHQLAIGETTWGGIAPYSKGNDMGIDYGNLIYLALQRAKNCREAIKIMAELTEQYGYADGGESFSLCDPNEVWIFEITSKGSERGALWVARRVPEGYVCGHANQARITSFPLMKKGSYASIDSRNLKHLFRPEVECVYSADMIKFARNAGLFNGKKDEEFSFADTFNPLTFSGLRACEARVYAMFNRVNSQMKQYEPFVMGQTDYRNVTDKERLPLWIVPDSKLSVHDIMELMRDHFEGTPMDMTGDVGAGPFHCPYRWRPMDFEVNGKKYVHERAISTQQTGFSFVAQCRSWLPNKLGGIIWFGVDDTYSTVYCPMFCGIDQVPLCFEEGNGSMSQYSETSAFWLFNRVSNFCYLRYDSMIVDVRHVQAELENDFISIVDKISQQYQNSDDSRLVAVLNKTSNRCADQMMRRWTSLDRLLLMKYIDGNIKQTTPDGNIKTTPTGVVAWPKQPPYPQWFYQQIVDDHGDVLLEK